MNAHGPKITWKETKELLFLCAVLCAAAMLLDLLGIGCPIRFLTGIPCAGCGLSRAALAAVHLHFREALSYHPLIFLVPCFPLLVLIRSRVPGNIRKLCTGILISIFLAVYVVRLWKHDPVLEIDITSGLIYRILRRVTHVLQQLR